ncbi:hypothetical protein [Engelhardtia mirabilis]|uniref:Glycosyltransferase RgtA/B/C/D-like domain-containing protein n=1 Tax=Engelhardtia mirabilis TaxID=2528011 RepID=A0A518BLA9_9BACT|nr:hypothetical protein Pla133_28480 [Planctomycetes bacterium Pla133]QDV02085.1 hypothetical protein Pla86_28470 [Planctomycetes bacterium Pla86]
MQSSDAIGIRRPEVRRVGTWVLVLCVGLLLRLAAASLPWRALDLVDHGHFVAWQSAIRERGLGHVYGGTPGVIGRPLDQELEARALHVRAWRADRAGSSERVADQDRGVLRPGEGMEFVLSPNYGPGFMWVLAGLTRVHALFDPALRPYTRVAVGLYAAVSGCFALLGAWWLVLVARELGADRRGELAVFAWGWCGPAPILNEGLRQQVDGWAMAWMVGVMLCGLRGRWAMAGAALTIGVLTKPQAIVAAPFLALCLMGGAVCAASPSGAGAPSGQIATHDRKAAFRTALGRAAAVLAGVALAFVSLGLVFQLAEGSSWMRASLLGNAAGHPLGQVGSWYATNLWAGVQMLSGEFEAASTLLGASWSVWGAVLFTACGGAAALTWWSRFGPSRDGWAFLVLLVGLAGYFFCTRMSGRYLIYLLPFAILATYSGRVRLSRTVLIWLSVILVVVLTRFLWWPESRGVGFRAHQPAPLPAWVLWLSILATAGSSARVWITVARPSRVRFALRGGAIG